MDVDGHGGGEVGEVDMVLRQTLRSKRLQSGPLLHPPSANDCWKPPVWDASCMTQVRQRAPERFRLTSIPRACVDGPNMTPREHPKMSTLAECLRTKR
eukprot:723708-Pyramimonas_sp.AAC.2